MSASAALPFDAAFRAQELRYEVIYATLTSIAYGITLAIMLGGALFVVGPDELYGEASMAWWPRLFIFGSLGISAAIRARARRAIRGEGDLSIGLRVVDVVLQISLIHALFAAESTFWASPVFVLYGPYALLLALIVALTGLRLSPTLSRLAGAYAGLTYVGGALLYLSWGADSGLPDAFLHPWQHVIRGVLLFSIGWCTGSVTRRLRAGVVDILRTAAERDRIFRTFGHYVSPTVAAQLVDNPMADATEIRAVCVLFLDIRGFTAFSESRSPTEVVAALDLLFAFAVQAVDDHGGIVNKFLGDGFMAIFGAPLSLGSPAADARAAVACGRQILAELDAGIAAGSLPALGLGIGVHCGDAVVGSVGPPGRREYTVIGDVVNVTARIEGMNKPLGARLLVSDRVLQHLDDPRPIAVHDQVIVKGREEPLRLAALA